MRGLARGRMLRGARRWLPTAALAMGLAGALAPAQAQDFGGWGGGWSGGWGGGSWGNLRSVDIGQAVAQQGFRIIAPMRRAGPVFVADVLDRRGRRERLVVAAADGQILQRFYLDDPRLPGHVPRGALASEPEDPMDGGGALVPPASIPNQGRQGFGAPVYGSRGYETPDAGGRDRDPVYGSRGNDDNPDDVLVEPARPRPVPKMVRPPKPRIVERTPDAAQPQRDVVPAKPHEPLRLPGEPDHANDRPAEPNPTVASRPPEPPRPAAAPQLAPAGPAPAATGPRMKDPLAIPGNEPRAANRPAEAPRATVAATPAAAPRVAPGTVTGAPARPAPPTPAKGGDVPAAPLD